MLAIMRLQRKLADFPAGVEPMITPVRNSITELRRDSLVVSGHMQGKRG